VAPRRAESAAPARYRKGFPEDEMVMDVAISAEGDADITDKVVYENVWSSRTARPNPSI